MALQNDQNYRDNMKTRLRDLAEAGSVDEVADMLEKNRWLLNDRRTIYSAMDSATRKGNNAVLGVFFDRGISADITNQDGNTMLQVAAYKGHIGTLIYLYDHGADINHRDNLGNTALHYAALALDIDFAKKLVDLGADAGLHGLRNLTPIATARRQMGHKFADELAAYIARRSDSRIKRAFTRRRKGMAP